MAISPAFSTTIKRDTLSLRVDDVDPGDGSPQIRRTMPTRIITINNKDLRDEDIIHNVSKVKVIERADGLSTANITILNEDMKLTNDKIFAEQNIVQIWTGYPDTGLQKRGSFRINKTKVKFRAGDMLEIELYCVGHEYDLMFTEKTRTWEKMKYSDIAKAIADEYGFEALVQDTKKVITHVAQWAQSDMKLLEELARLRGYDVYVDESYSETGKPVLHFHEPIFTEPILGPLYFSGDERASLNFFEVTTDTWFRGVKWVGNQFDPVTKEFIQVESEEDELSDFQKKLDGKLPGVNSKNKRKASDISSVVGEQPVRFLNDEGHLKNREEVQNQVQKFSEFSRYAVSGCGRVIGLEEFQKRRVVRILGIGRFEGDYYITHAEHCVSDTYDLKFSVIKISTEDFESRRQEPRDLISFGKETIRNIREDDLSQDLVRESSVTINQISGPSNFSREIT